MSLRRRWKWVIGATLAAVITAAAVIVGYRVPFSSERLRREVIKTLSERLESQVELTSLELRTFPRLSAVGHGLVIRHRRRPDVPLIAVEQFTVGAELAGLLRKHVAQVTLEGLTITIPPGDDADKADKTGNASAEPAEPKSGKRPRSQVVIDELIADGATFTTLPRDPEKRPRVWQLHSLRVEHVGLLDPMPFRSVLTNAVPPGQIDTTGSFGPWQVDDPGATPVNGDFTFDNADLSVFKGIAGILSARGTYDGTLSRIESNGQTDTPDFTVTTGGHPLPLKTTYRAIVDGTNGNTTLERVEATLVETLIVASGGVYDVPDVKGRNVRLDVNIENGRLEDVLQLAVPTPAPTMKGALTLQTAFNLPPGEQPVVEKLELDGTFSIKAGRFTDPGVQGKINTLSGKARPGEEASKAVTSDFRGRFRLGGGQLTLTPVRFNVPGAMVEMTGGYGLRTGQLAFAGQMLMEARISQTLDGWKSWLARPFDPLFRKNGQTFIPLKIGGTRNDPKFGVDMKRVFDKDAPPKPPARPPRTSTARPTATSQSAHAAAASPTVPRAH